tara:strand:+ start:670 stop:816 length:147 start_codon:yes stop_codon:yes gene_type:complete
LLNEKVKATKKEMFDIKSKKGIKVAGKTIKLDKIYTNLLLLIQGIIFE